MRVFNNHSTILTNNPSVIILELSSLPSTPTKDEIAEASECQTCRSYLQKNGPTCRHCRKYECIQALSNGLFAYKRKNKRMVTGTTSRGSKKKTKKKNTSSIDNDDDDNDYDDVFEMKTFDEGR